MNKLLLSLLLIVLIFPFLSAAPGYCNPNLPGGQNCNPVVASVGIAGANGSVGPAGPQGPQGIPGTNGTNGINGINGTNGANGTSLFTSLNQTQFNNSTGMLNIVMSWLNGLYYGKNNPSVFWNASSNGFNKTYADTLYYGISNPSSYCNSTNGLCPNSSGSSLWIDNNDGTISPDNSNIPRINKSDTNQSSILMNFLNNPKNVLWNDLYYYPYHSLTTPSLNWVQHITGNAFASSDYDFGNSPEYAFDGHYLYGSEGGTGWGAYGDCSDGTEWVGWDFGAGNEKTITEYKFYRNAYGWGDSYAPSGWTFEGSNDYLNWDTLDTQTNQSATDGQWWDYSFGGSNSYEYYRLRINDVAGGGCNNVDIAELDFKDSNTGWQFNTDYHNEPLLTGFDLTWGDGILADLNINNLKTSTIYADAISIKGQNDTFYVDDTGLKTNKITAITTDPKINVNSITNWNEVLILDTAVPSDKKGATTFFNGSNEFHWNSLTGDYYATDFKGQVIETGNKKSLGSLKEGYNLNYNDLSYYKTIQIKSNRSNILRKIGLNGVNSNTTEKIKVNLNEAVG